MRHALKQKKLNRTSSHMKSMLKNMACSLIMHEQISTTLPKAKNIRPYVEKLITLARKSDLSVRRKLFSVLQDDDVVDKLLSVLSPRYILRNGGYTRIMKSGFRYGDNAPLAIIEFVDRDVSEKGRNYHINELILTSDKNVGEDGNLKLDTNITMIDKKEDGVVPA